MNQVTLRTVEQAAAGFLVRAGVADILRLSRAAVRVEHKRKVKRGSLYVFEHVTPPETKYNVITNVGRVQLHTQTYATTGILTNGFNYVALSNDALTENAASTTLSTEIAANGLTRAQGTVTLPTGAGTSTTVAKTFTASGSQSAQKTALFTASSAGVMNHALAFTQRALITGDTLTITFTITIT